MERFNLSRLSFPSHTANLNIKLARQSPLTASINRAAPIQGNSLSMSIRCPSSSKLVVLWHGNQPSARTALSFPNRKGRSERKGQLLQGLDVLEFIKAFALKGRGQRAEGFYVLYNLLPFPVGFKTPVKTMSAVQRRTKKFGGLQLVASLNLPLIAFCPLPPAFCLLQRPFFPLGKQLLIHQEELSLPLGLKAWELD
jgi:hypothetical protein